MNNKIPLLYDPYTKRFNNLTINDYSKKIYERMERNYQQSIKPNPVVINREYRPQQNGYLRALRNKEKKIINSGLESFTVRKNYRFYAAAVIIVIVLLGGIYGV